jgi:hypothetical protein
MHKIISCITAVIIFLISLGETILCADATTFIHHINETTFENIGCDYVLTTTNLIAICDFFVATTCFISIFYEWMYRKKISCSIKCAMSLHSPLIIYVFAAISDYYHDKSCYNFIVDGAPNLWIFLLIHYVIGCIVLALFIILIVIHVSRNLYNYFKKHRTYKQVQQMTKLESIPKSESSSIQIIELTKINSIV